MTDCDHGNWAIEMDKEIEVIKPDPEIVEIIKTIVETQRLIVRCLGDPKIVIRPKEEDK